MKFSIATVSAFAAAVLANPAFTNNGFDIQENKPFTLTFTGCPTEGCTIYIETGPSTNLVNVEAITATATGGSFTFTPTNLPSGTYAFKIVDNSNGDTNYSPQWTYQGTGAPLTTATGSVTATESATASATNSASHSASATDVTSTGSATASHTTLSTSVLTSSASETSSATSSVHITSAARNSTTLAPTSSHASTTSAAHTTSAPATTTTVPPTSGVGHLSSPLALVAGLALAIAYLS